MTKRLIFFIVIALIAVGTGFFLRQQPAELPASRVMAEEPDRIVSIGIASGDTFSALAEQAGLEPDLITTLVSASANIHDLATIRVGKTIEFVFDHNSGKFKQLRYEPNTEESLSVIWDGSKALAEKTPIQYEVRIQRASGTIESSLYETALEKKLDERAVIALAEVFAWQIDFAVDVQQGDSFSMIYEERYRGGNYAMPGRILAASFSNAGTLFQGYYYRENDGHEGYFDPEGKSLQKILLKSPLQYRYISSGFTNARRDPITGHTAPHRAVDYAAPYGTPAVTVGEGTVVRAGWNGGYGLSVDVRHNETYTTRYGHFSRLAVKAGEKVTQGEIIGYVGSTGHSTGPHLHYEIYKNGTPVNPLTIEVPSDKALAAETIPAFQEHIKQFVL